MEKPGVKNSLLIYIAWGVMLAVSPLLAILFKELTGSAPSWLLWFNIGGLALFAVVTFFLEKVRPLRSYALILLALFIVEEGVAKLTGSALWQGWFGGTGAPFTSSMMGIQLGRLIVSLLMIGVLLLMRYRRSDFFLQMGNLKAPITPVPWLGFPKADPWTRFGGQFALYISLGTLVFLLIGGGIPSGYVLLKLLPIFPFILLFATLNSFNEEMTYRASLLAGLEPVLGPQQAVLIAALFFGIGHYNGVPYGIIGVVMASFLGWMMGKAMVETRGFFWAWFIHFLQDVLIFTFMAIGSIVPGG